MLDDIPDSPSREAYLWLVRAHEALVGEFQALFRHEKITPTQFNVLRILIQAEPEGVSCSRISRELIHRVPDVTRLLDRMERNGLIRRGRNPRDRRVVLAFLEEKGRQLCRRLYQPIAAVHAGQFSALSDSEKVQLARLLRKAVEE